jgi:serpin B
MSHRRRYGPLVLILAVAAVGAVVALLVPRLSDRTTPHAAPVSPGVRIAGHIGTAVLLRSAPSGAPPNGDAQRLATTEQAFTLALLHRLVAADGSNTTVCPASLALALSMLQQGARGETETQIAATLQNPEMSSAEQGAAWRSLTAAWATAAKSGQIALESANSLWVQSGMRLPNAFMAALERYYSTGVWQVDFAHDSSGATSAINDWTRSATHNRIPKLFDKGVLTEYTRVVLANAVYFKAAWTHPFDAAGTSDGPFTLRDGTRATASFMQATMPAPISITPQYSAVQLPYRGGRFAALAIMPTGTSLHRFAAGLSDATLSDIVHALEPQQVLLTMPRFETSSTFDLKSTLAALGMPAAFTDAADFTGIGERLKVDSVVQRTYLKVAEKGTEAAAATGIGISATSRMADVKDLTLDHPFLFLIRDTVTGAILFASQVEHPQA